MDSLCHCNGIHVHKVAMGIHGTIVFVSYYTC